MRYVPALGQNGRVKGAWANQQGFTLVELLAVLVIIGVIISFAMLSIADRAQDDRLENEARRLTELIKLASDEAVVLGVELGLRSDGLSYGFITINENGAWAPYETDGPLRRRKLPEGMQLEITTEDFEPPPAEDGQLVPNLLFLSSGELSPFSLLLTAEGASRAFRIEGALTGKIERTALARGEY